MLAIKLAAKTDEETLIHTDKQNEIENRHSHKMAFSSTQQLTEDHFGEMLECVKSTVAVYKQSAH